MQNIIYLDESAINEELISHHGGELEQTVERITRNTNVGGEAGGEVSDPTGWLGKLRAALNASHERGKEEELVYNLNDEVAKFNLLLEVLKDSGAPTIDGEFDSEDRDNLVDESPIQISAPLIRTPLSELKEQFDLDTELSSIDKGMEFFERTGLFDDEEMRETREQIEQLGYATTGMTHTLSGMADRENVYRTATDSEVDFVMDLEDGHFRTRPYDFPSPGRRYAIVGKVVSKIGRGDKVRLLNFSELASKSSDNPREQRTEERRMEQQMANAADDMLDRDVDASEFHLSYPDVQLRPLAIF
jgi:hypothetical protein